MEELAKPISFDIDPFCEEEPAPAAPAEVGQTAFYGDILSALAAVAPPGSTVRAVGLERMDGILRAGYRTVEGDADVAIAFGGEREFEAARAFDCRHLVLCPTHSFECAASAVYRTTDESFAVMTSGKKPAAAVFDPESLDPSRAAVFGELVALDLCAFDAAFGAYMRGEKVDVELIDEAAALVTDLTSALSSHEKERAFSARVLAEAGKKAARIIESRPALLHASGAAQVAEAMRMLFAAEDRQSLKRGEVEMLLTPYVLDLYIKSLTSSRIEFPPDNGRRIDSLCEYFGADLRRACLYTTPIYPPLKMRLCEYRRDEFRNEQMRLLTRLRSRHIAARSVFKRLCPDDGFSLRTVFDSSDLGICVALAPDVFAADTMLSFLKQTGRLEKYLV